LFTAAFADADFSGCLRRLLAQQQTNHGYHYLMKPNTNPRPAMNRRLRDILPALPIVFGLAEPEAAASIGISVSKFRELVADGRMPWPRRVDGRLVYDVDELRSAFKELPHAGQSEADTWADVA
jgi:hypothetical protein